MPRTKKVEEAVEVKTEAVAAVKEPVKEAPAAAKTAKKPAAKKAPAKAKTEVKQTVKIQFGGDEFDLADIQKAVEKDIKAKHKGKIKTVEVYLKPEDKAVYYVVNSDFSDKVSL